MLLSHCLPIVKPFDDVCNLKCSYCYMEGVINPSYRIRLMNDDTLFSLTDFFCSARECVEFIWHGGEPLLAGINFFEKAMHYQEPWIGRGKKIKNSIQTNATLVNDEWVSFFRDNKFLVGTSLDGPSHMHNIMRTDGKMGSFDAVMRGIHLLKEGGIFNGVICCVSTANCSHPEEVLDFFVAQDIKSIKFLRVKGLDRNGNPYPGSITPNQYVDFLLAVFKKWLEIDDPEIEIRNIKSVIDILMGGNFRECVYMGACYNYVTVYGDGSIYACDALSQHDFLCFGNVKNRIFENQNFSKFIEFIETQKRSCRSCRWFDICRGGCLQDRKIGLDSNGVVENVSCASLKRFYSEIYSVLGHYDLLSKKC
ncbi:MAG: SPASM domain-containing protein [Nanoarchaeota archaeon]|nr:SPASM domain-containing protein [Nanoarchaeota archaeon]